MELLPFTKKKILVTAGPTYEALDPVRYIGNYSSGKMGIAIAEEMYKRGASVKLICGPVNNETLYNGIDTIKVTSAEESFGDLVVGSTPWTHTSYDRLGTEDEKVVESYRTLHNDICFALELVTSKNISADPSRKVFREILMSFTFAQ